MPSPPEQAAPELAAAAAAAPPAAATTAAAAEMQRTIAGSVSGRFDSFLAGLSIESIGKGHVTCSLKVDTKLSNVYSTLHGGCSATIVDMVSTIAMVRTQWFRVPMLLLPLFSCRWTQLSPGSV